MVRFLIVFLEYVFPACSAIAGVSMGIGIVTGITHIAGVYWLGWNVFDPAADSVIAVCGATAMSMGGMLLLGMLCLMAAAAGEATAEWLVTRSELYQRADREAEFWMQAHMRVCQELDNLKRNKHAQEQPQVEVVAAPVNDYW